LSNDERIWKRHIQALVGDAALSAPKKWLQSAPTPTNANGFPSVLPRASSWKIKFSQILQSRYPGHEEAERHTRDLKRRAISLVLRGVKEVPDEIEEGQELRPDLIPTKAEISMLRMLHDVRYIPIKLAFLGDPKIGRTMTIMKYLRSYPLDNPLPDEHAALMTPSTDQFGSNLFHTVEKGPGDRLFHVTIVDPPSDNIMAQISSLRDVDAVLLGFACNNLETITSVADKWVPFVRKWLGNSVPISVVGLMVDLIAQGVSGTTIFEMLYPVGIRSFDLCLPPYKKSFCRAWTPPDCPMVDGTWL
jgi:hypothetical protein